MDEIKHKVLGLIKKDRDLKVPTMGFSEYFVQNALVPGTYQHSSIAQHTNDDIDGKYKLSDQEILESTEKIYFEENVNTEIYELKKLTDADQFDCQSIEGIMLNLKKQHKVISKKVLQLILDQRNACNEEFSHIQETEKLLQQSVLVCQKARSHLSSSKRQLTTTSLEILATYKKRQILLDLLDTLNTLKNMKSIDQHIQKYLDEENYSGAISILLENKNLSEQYSEYKCVESLSQKLQDTLLLTEVQLENVLNEIPTNFDPEKYSKIQEAYKLLGKTLITMDQLHMNFISTIHSSAFLVLKKYSEQNAEEQKQKLLFEQMCESITFEKYIPCLIDLCKAIWRILVSYYQVTQWHQKYPENVENHDEYIQEKLAKGTHRIWNDVQSKVCIYLNSTKLDQLKYEYFIQILAIVQRLKKVGVEFCDEQSEKMMESMRRHSLEFFKRYHTNCLEEINIFLDHEIWVPITSFNDITQLQEYKSVKRAFQRYAKLGDYGQNGVVVDTPTSPSDHLNLKSDSSAHSQDESSIFGSCGYFLRFTEKSSPFDGGFDTAMLTEDILAGIADESSCYYSEDSSDNNDNYEETFGSPAMQNQSNIIVSNSSLTVLRCIGRYLHFCKLFHSISPNIVMAMTELIDFYVYAVHHMFSKDLPVAGDNLYSNILRQNLNRIGAILTNKVKKWPPSTEMIDHELVEAEQMYGLSKRIIAVESCVCLVDQFDMMLGYIEHLIQTSEDKAKLTNFMSEVKKCVIDLRKPIYMCVTSRVLDVQTILVAMSKVKWDRSDITVEHSNYVNVINRSIQLFAMRLEEISSHVILPKESIWDCFAHILTHLLVEGFSNAKKCSTGGRALMQLDFTNVMSILQLISGMKHPTHQAYVEQYVKAFYLPKDSLEDWIKVQKGYSTKHFIGLVMCTCNNDKRMRQKLLALVDGNGNATVT